MRDPFSWSVPLGRLFGIAVRVHVLFPVIAAALILRVACARPSPPHGTVTDACMVMVILFISVLLHEFGHCLGARLVDGDAEEIMIWPLGGLAAIEVPHRPKAHLIAVASGPAVNLLIGLCSLLFLCLLTDFAVRPPLNPFWYPYRVETSGGYALVQLFTWDGKPWAVDHLGMNNQAIAVLARVFWVSWLLFLLNIVLIGFPMDGGRIFQCLLWFRYGFRKATVAAIFAGFLTVLVVGIYALVENELLFGCLALFIYVTCRHQLILLETGSEDLLFGYDFSQGYTSLEGEQVGPRRPKSNMWQRWIQRRAVRKLQRQQEQRETEERRMDELLEKVQREGLPALTDEERRFLKRVSDRYRNRQ